METIRPNDSNSSGVSWSAVFGGAFVAAALSLALLALGTGIGLSVASPYSNSAGAASSLRWTGICWLILMEIIGSSLGGYLAGRLRTKWASIHSHEVYFRDTAHGFLTWAVALVMSAAFLASVGTAIGGSTIAHTGTEHAGSARSAAHEYYVESLLRTPTSTNAAADDSVRDQVSVIFAHALLEGALPAADRSYLTKVVAARTDMNESEASTRVDDSFAQLQEASNRTRHDLAHAMYWTFLALLIGAFCASFSATIGGKQRDQVLVVSS